MSEISIIVAMTRSGVMGVNNSLPWSLPGDLKRFKQLTLGHPIIMGRKTYDSIGKPLPGRKNIVISRNKKLSCPSEVMIVESLSAAIEAAGSVPKKFIIGGAQIIAEALSLTDKLYLTWIEKEFLGDVYFPDISRIDHDFKIISSETLAEPFGHSFVDYIRRT